MMTNRTKKATLSVKHLAPKSSSQKELPAISWTGYSSKGEATQRRIMKVQDSLAAVRKELMIKQQKKHKEKS